MKVLQLLSIARVAVGRLALSVALLIGMPLLGHAGSIVYDADADFSIGGNPNGAWSYGYTTSLGGPLTLYTLSTHDQYFNPNFIAWYYPGLLNNPTVLKNTSGTVQQGEGANLLPGELAFHPGQFGQYSVIRWTAPTNGTITISATFEGRDNIEGTTTDVHVLNNDQAIFNGEVTGFGPSTDVSFSATLNVVAGATIDVADGYGTNDNFGFDTTGISDTIVLVPSSVPEPSSMTLLLVGVSIALLRHRLRLWSTRFAR